MSSVCTKKNSVWPFSLTSLHSSLLLCFTTLATFQSHTAQRFLTMTLPSARAVFPDLHGAGYILSFCTYRPPSFFKEAFLSPLSRVAFHLHFFSLRPLLILSTAKIGIFFPACDFVVPFLSYPPVKYKHHESKNRSVLLALYSRRVSGVDQWIGSKISKKCQSPFSRLYYLSLCIRLVKIGHAEDIYN